MVHYIRKFTTVKKRAYDLAILLQPARPGSSLPATLIGLHGDELFQALVALQVPEVATKNVHLEAALAAQRLAMQETVDLHIHVYEEIVYIGHYKASEDRKTLALAAGIFGRHCSEARQPGHESRCYLGAIRWAGTLSRGGGRRR